jgi:glutamine amidotransferase
MHVITVGIVDYGVGNHASVSHTMRELGYRVRIGYSAEILDTVDVLVLPGVGAYPPAMQAIAARGLNTYLKEQVRQQRPLVGICLGMQLLATEGHELGYTAGLDLIPGKVVPLNTPRWHIGWNSIETTSSDTLLAGSDGDAFYFNHSFVFDAPQEYVAAVARHGQPINAVVRRGRVAGVQFHPEKSQLAGKRLLKNIIEGLHHA